MAGVGNWGPLVKAVSDICKEFPVTENDLRTPKLEFTIQFFNWALNYIHNMFYDCDYPSPFATDAEVTFKKVTILICDLNKCFHLKEEIGLVEWDILTSTKKVTYVFKKIIMFLSFLHSNAETLNESFNELMEEASKLAKVNSMIEQEKTKRNKLTLKKPNLETQFKNLENEIEELASEYEKEKANEKEIKDLEKDLVAKQLLIDEKSKHCQKMKAELEEKKETLRQVNTLNDKLAKLNSASKEADDLNTNLQQRIKDFECTEEKLKELKKLNDLLNEVTVLAEKYNSEKKTSVFLEDDLIRLKNEIDMVKQNINIIGNEIHKKKDLINKTIKSNTKINSMLEEYKELDEAYEMRKNLVKELAKKIVENENIFSKDVNENKKKYEALLKAIETIYYLVA